MPPRGEGAGQRRGRWGAPALALALGLGLAGFWPRPGGSQAPAEAPSTSSALQSRFADCPTCAAMAARLPAGEFTEDPHTFACRACHHPHVQKSADAWRGRCTTPDCHPRPWPRTVFHRVKPEVFLDCLNCHRPHTWTLDGENCLGCHAAQLDTLDAAPATDRSFAGFSHRIHHQVECKKCHESKQKHAVALVRTADDCQACHHGPDVGVPCATCHGGKVVAGAGKVNASVSFSVWPEARTRSLPFAHERHRGFECATCHGEGETTPSATLCASCHDSHHRPEAACVACHRQPPRKAHPLAVHASSCSGSGCHENPPVARMEPVRNLCLTCHQDQADHNPGRNCAGCHKVAPTRP